MRDLGAGIGYMMKGQRWVFRHGRWLGIGMLPALITLVLYAGALVGLAYGADDLASWASPFADDWDSPWRGLLRGFLTVLVFAGGLLFAVISFTAVCLLVGQPFYESLAAAVDETEGGAPPSPGLSLWRELLISARDSLRVLLRVVLFGAVIFVLGFIPLIGQTVVPALGFCVSGFFLAVELTAVAFQRREVPLKERFRLHRGRMLLTLGFGVPLTLFFLIPFVAVFVMPGAVAGATLMARDLHPVPAGDDEDERTDDEVRWPVAGGGDVSPEHGGGPILPTG